MKLSFSTLGCPDWSWNDILSTAKDLGFNGIELRGITNQIYLPDALPFSNENMENTKKKLKELNIEISCLTSSCYLYGNENNGDCNQEGKDYIDLAQQLNVPYVRVLGDKNPEPGTGIEINTVKNNLKRLGEYASNKNVTVLIETNGIFADSNKIKKLMEEINSPYVGVLWDVHHPFRFMGESFEETFNNLKPWIKHIHLKDSIVVEDKIIYKMIGQGDLPIDHLIKLLAANHYDGFISLEWVKRWKKDLENPGIVFPHFVSTMKRLIAKYSDTNLPEDELWEITFGDLLDKIADKYPDHEALVYGDQDFRVTYSEFRDLCNKAAKGLLTIGVTKGDHVAIWSTNYPEWVISMFATAKIGAVLVTVNTNYKIFEAEYLLRQSDSNTLILMEGYKDTNYVEILNELCPELKECKPGALKSERLPYLKNIIYLDNKEYPGMYQWEDLYTLSNKISDEALHSIQKSLDIHDTINMQYTSGTTGFPKGVMLTHYNVVNNGRFIGDCMQLTKEDRLCIPVPFFHCFGCVLGIMACITHASTIVAVDHYNPKIVMDTIQKEKCTAVHGVPTMFIAMLEHSDFNQYDFSSLRTGIMAGSPCPEKVMRDVVYKMGAKNITIAYGQTEASPVCTQTSADDSIDRRVSTVGTLLPFTEGKIIDPETGKDAPPNTQGEFVARGYNVMKGYYKLPEATSQAIDADGWLHTGDLATVDEEGYYKITGRIKDMIIRGGENIYPKEIEEFLYTHPKISDVQVVGVFDRKYGEEIVAYIIKKEKADLTEEEVKKFALASMSRHKVPKYIAFINAFPQTASGKIQKYKLREMAKDIFNLEAEEDNE
jgi:fatty-acyl-CoA synthase